MTEKCPKSMKKIYRNLLKRESIDPCGRRETFKAQSNLSRLRAIFQGSELVKQGPEGFQRSRSQSWLVFFLLLVNSLGNTNREKQMCFQMFQQLTVLLSIMIATYLPTVYHISSRKHISDSPNDIVRF